MYFEPKCGSPHCTAGYDCHPNLMNAEVEALYWRCKSIDECCRWSINRAFEASLEERGGERPADAQRTDCQYGPQCYCKDPNHLIDFTHPNDRDPVYKP